MEFSERDLRRLLDREGESPCVSLYMTAKGTPDTAKADEIAFRNLVDAAEGELKKLGEDAAVLAPAQALLRDRSFWGTGGNHGLAMFLCGGEGERYRVPLTFRDQATVSPRFRIKPLLPLLGDGLGEFHVLAMNRGSVRLLSCTRTSVREIELPDAPGSVEEAAALDESGKPLQQHTGTSGPGRGVMFHGQDRQDSAHQEDVAKFCRQVDEAVSAALSTPPTDVQSQLPEPGTDPSGPTNASAPGTGKPIVFAGSDRLFSVFRTVSTLPGLLEETISSNPAQADDAQLRDQAMTLLEPLARDARERDVERFRTLAVRDGLTLTDVLPVCTAAARGRVDVLFVSGDDAVWGNADDGTPQPHGKDRQPGDVDLLDLAAADALRTGARVHAVPRAEMPTDAPLAAVLRYKA